MNSGIDFVIKLLKRGSWLLFFFFLSKYNLYNIFQIIPNVPSVLFFSTMYFNHSKSFTILTE